MNNMSDTTNKADYDTYRISGQTYLKEVFLGNKAWKLIEAPLMWVEGDRTEVSKWWGNRYSKPEFHERLSVVRQVERHALPACGHMLHHDQPEAVAKLLADFLRG